MTPADVVQTLIRARYAQGMTQRDVAAQVFCAPGAISMLESGKRRFHLDMLFRYAAAVGVEIKVVTQ